MNGIELGLAIVAALDLCFKYGNHLVGICNSVKNAESELSERFLRICNNWKRTSLQLDFLKKVWQTLDEEHRTIQERLLHVLVSKLKIAISKIDKLIVGKESRTLSVKDLAQQMPGVKRWKYVLLKERLDKTIEELDIWQKMFDPSWFLILKAPSAHIDRQLTSTPLLDGTRMLRNALRGDAQQEVSVFLPEDGLKSAHITDIPFSSSKVAQRAGSSKLLILDSVPCPVQSNVQRLTKDVRELARKLVHAEPSQFGLLKCVGVVREPAPSITQQIYFSIVFRAVDGHAMPRSLRACLIAGEANHSLSDRLSVARDLAKSINFVHTFGFVHKNVRPENILLSTDSPSSLGSSFLLGFEDFRNAEGQTLRFGDSAWEKNLYRHPRRQGLMPEADFVMQHDIYSLGVCLLEVGLWESFVSYNEDGTCVPSPILESSSHNLPTGNSTSAKDALVFLTRAVLPKRMGSRYAGIVETCITCLDEANSDFGDESEFQDADGILVGVRYIEKVLLELDNVLI